MQVLEWQWTAFWSLYERADDRIVKTFDAVGERIIAPFGNSVLCRKAARLQFVNALNRAAEVERKGCLLYTSRCV